MLTIAKKRRSQARGRRLGIKTRAQGGSYQLIVTADRPEAQAVVRLVREFLQSDTVKQSLPAVTVKPRRRKKSLAHTTALLSEAKLRQIWDTPEEDAAWSHL